MQLRDFLNEAHNTFEAKLVNGIDIEVKNSDGTTYSLGLNADTSIRKVGIEEHRYKLVIETKDDKSKTIS